mgnify:CR=1 FL=1
MAKDKNGKQLPPGVTQRPDGRYMGRFTYQGERYTLYDNSDPKRLRKAMEDKRYELEHGLRGKIDNVTVDKWAKIWLTEYKANSVKPSTYVLYTNRYTWYIAPQIGKLMVKDIKNAHIQKIVNSMKSQGYSRSTIKKAYAVISDMMNYAVKNDMIPKNPCTGVVIPKEEPRERRVMSAEEQEQFEEYMRGDPCETIFIVALYTGMRIGEVLGLTWDDVDFKNNQIRINKTLVCLQKGKGEKCTHAFQTPKTNSSIRTIPMVSKVSKAFKLHKWQQSTLRMETGKLFRPQAGFENLVFVSDSGSPLYETFVNRHLKKIVTEINERENEAAAKEKRKPVIFKSVSPHTLRHTFATRAFEKGMKPKTVQEILGHSSLNMTMDLYTHVTESTKAEEMAVFEKQA